MKDLSLIQESLVPRGLELSLGLEGKDWDAGTISAWSAESSSAAGSSPDCGDTAECPGVGDMPPHSPGKEAAC